MPYLNERIRLRLMVPLFTIVLAAGLVNLSACDMLGVSGASGSSDESGSARMQVLLVDNPFPFDLVDEVNVTISRVDLRDGRNTVTVMNETRSFELLELRNGVSAELGDLEIPAGEYKEARLVVEDASVLMVDGKIFDLKVPSGVVKVKLDGVVVEDGQDVTLTLDFDVSKSFVVQGNPRTPAGIKGFLLKPTVVSKGMKENGRRGGDRDDDDRDREVSGIVTAVETIGAWTFITVADLEIMIVPGETKFEGVFGVEGLIAGESFVEVEYFEDAETGVLVATKVEIEDEEEEEDEEGEDDDDDDDEN